MMKRKLFATRTIEKSLKNLVTDKARILVATARVLVGYKCKKLTSLQVLSNRFNSTITNTVQSGSDSGEYTKYLVRMTEALNYQRQTLPRLLLGGSLSQRLAR